MRYFLAALFILFNFAAASAATLTLTPNVNFGTISYSAAYSGSSSITVSPNGGATLSGSGGIISQTAGVRGVAQFTKGTQDTVLNVRVANSAGTYVISNSCGSMTISNIKLEGGVLSLLGQTFTGNSLNIDVGATATVNYVNDHNCTISGTISGALLFSTIVGDLLPSTPANLNVTLIVGSQPVVLAHKTGAALNFGRICLNTTALQQVNVSTTGAVTGSNMPCTPTAVTADSFSVSGPASTSFTVTLPTSTTITNGTSTLNVNNFTSDCTAGCQITSRGVTFNVGARLSIPSSSSVGTYTGTYVVSITY